MTESVTFPIFVHIITIPMTFGFGFLLGWIIRAAAGKRSARKSRSRLNAAP
jgi:hypothetical protein